jgi:hypothetical protein
LTISDRDLADVAYAGLLDIHKGKLEGHEFLSVSQVFHKALANESRVKESGNWQNLNEKVNVQFIYLTTNLIIWTIVVRMSMLLSLHAHLKTRHTLVLLSSQFIENRQDEIKFTFDVGKCDKIFDELLSIWKIKLSHAIPLINDLKKCAYCKWDNSYSHATNDCNVFRQQIQSVINGGQLCLKQMQVDNNPFSINAMDLQGAKVRSVAPTGQTGTTAMRRPKMLKPKNPEADKWKVVKAKVRGKKKSFKPNFDYLLSKYVNQKAVTKNRSLKGIAAPSSK